MKEILKLVAVLEKKTQALETLETQVKDLKKEVKDLATIKLPAAMDDLGLVSFTTQEGVTLSRGENIFASLKDPASAYAWLEKTNNTGIIKNQLAIKLDSNQPDIRKKLLEALASWGFTPEETITIHPATLKKFCREAMESPELQSTFPRDAFGVYEESTIKITK